MPELDIHVHTTTSSCSVFPPDTLVRMALEMKLPAVVITNHHDSTGDVEYLKKQLEPNGIMVFPGLELTNQWGDFLVYGEDLREFQGYYGEFPVHALPRDDIAVVWAHPYRFYSEHEVNRVKFDVAPYIDAVEAVNGNCIKTCPHANDLAFRLAVELEKPVTAGSDAHHPSMFFMTYTHFTVPVNSYRDFIKAIKNGQVGVGV